MNKPEMKTSAGSVSCALWENVTTTADGKRIPLLSASIERRFKDSSGVWKSVNSYNRNELPQAIWCLLQAYGYMIKHANKSESGAQHE